MKGRRGRRWAVGAGTFLAALGLALVTPEAPRAASADCGSNDGPACWQNESCANFLFYEQCTTEYRYYPAGGVTSGDDGTGGGGDSMGDTELASSYDFSDECTWGNDYLGWEPIGC